MTTRIVVFVLLTPFFYSCEKTKEIDEAELRRQIMEQHNLQRKFHFEKMAEEFASILSENHISVNRGKIKSATKDENVTRFQGYFNSVEFEKWDDIVPPVIRFSDDYSLAYTIVNKEVVLTYVGEDGKRLREQTEFSWVAIYKKYPEGWKIDCISSTNLASVTNEIME